MHVFRTLILPSVVFAFVVTQITILATTVYLHRALSHRALSVKPAAALPIRFLIWVTTGMRPRGWVAVHRKHHSATDTADDPHSPIVHGFWRVQLGNVGLYKKVAGDEVAVRRYAGPSSRPARPRALRPRAARSRCRHRDRDDVHVADRTGLGESGCSVRSCTRVCT